MAQFRGHIKAAINWLITALMLDPEHEGYTKERIYCLEHVRVEIEDAIKILEGQDDQDDSGE